MGKRTYKPDARGTPLPERIDAAVIKEPNSGCWLWTKVINPAGYGKIGIDGKNFLAHRAAYEHFIGPIPDGMGVFHKCDTPACVRPDHLFSGPQLENMRDMRKKGRGPIRKGEMNHNVKLTLQQVEEIRNSKLPQRILGEKYGINPATACRIRNRKSWPE